MRIGHWQPRWSWRWVMPYRDLAPDWHVLEWAAGIGPFRLWRWKKGAR